jgi:hypothetical protein
MADWLFGERVEVVAGAFAGFQGTVVPPDLSAAVAVFSTDADVAFVRLEVYEGRPVVPFVAKNLRAIGD